MKCKNSMLSKIKIVLLLLVPVTVPIKENYNSLSLIALSVFALILFLKTKRFNKEVFWKFLPFIALFLLSLISLSYSDNQKHGWDMALRLLPFLLFPLIFSILEVSKRELIFVLKGFVFWMLAVCLYSHFIVLNKLFANGDSLYNLFNNHYSYMSLTNETIGLHSTYYAYCVLTAVMFIFYLLFQVKRRGIRILYFVLLGYFSFFIFHISARLPIAVLFLLYNVVIVYYFASRKEIKKGVYYLLGLYLISGVVLYNVRVTRYRFQQVFGFTYYDGSHHEDGKFKLRQWQSALSANGNMLFGNGIGDADESIYEAYPNFNLEHYKEREYNAHNQFIQTYVALGLVGVVILLWMFIHFTVLFHREKLYIGLIFVLSSFILFQTESAFERQAGIMLFVFFVSLFVQFSFQNSLIHHPETPTKPD